MNRFIRKRFFNEFTQGVQAHFDRDVIKVALSFFIPDDQGRRTEALAMEDDFASRHRAGIGNFRIAGRDLPDIACVVNDHALADGESQVFGG